MKCNNFDTIELYVDGVLSEDAAKALEDHIKACEECREIFETLKSTRDFLKEDLHADNSIDDKVLSIIDKDRYVNKRKKYAMFRGLVTIKSVLKPAAVILIISMALFYLGYGKYIKHDGQSGTKVLSGSDAQPFNMLVLGKDAYNSTDSIMLINYDPKNAKMNLLSIPRDIKVDLSGTPTKVNQVYLKAGAKAAVNSISDLLKVDIKYYLCFDTTSFQKSIDLLDGIYYNCPVDLDYDDPAQDLHIHIKKGQNHLTGKQVLELMRFRRPSRITTELKKHYDGSDLKRIEAQQGIIKSLIDQKLNVKYISKMNEIIKTILPEIETDISLGDSLKLVENIDKLNPKDVSMFTLSGKFDSRFDYIIDQDAAQSLGRYYFQSGM